MGTGEGS